MGLAPFAMAAAWRTFVHARRWLERGSRGGQGILEAAACGFAGAVLVVLPGIVTQPTQAPPYLLAYGGLAAIVGLAVGVVLWICATLTLRLYAREV
jgi:drug/metabolite transporter (DMT)-like permease